MSHKPTPYSPNFPASQGYAPPEDKPKESYPMQPQRHPHPAPGYAQHGAGYVQPLPGYSAPVVHQPEHAPQGDPGGTTIPQGLSNCPPGLEYLANCPPGFEYLSMIDRLLVQFVGFETNKIYTVKSGLLKKVYYGVEDKDCCSHYCMRPFDMKIMDSFQREVIHIHRVCDLCCFPCCLQSMEVTAPPGTVIGSIEQERSICKPCFAIKNASGDTVLRIKGPWCIYSMCGNVEFNVYSVDGETKVGKISKCWSSDNIGIRFPMDLDVKVKTVLLAACFLIDFMYYELPAS